MKVSDKATLAAIRRLNSRVDDIEISFAEHGDYERALSQAREVYIEPIVKRLVKDACGVDGIEVKWPIK